MKKIIITVIIVAILVGGYFYYTLRLQPNLFVSSFCEKVEYEGADSFELRDYLLSDFDITPLKTWETYYEESKTENTNLSEEKLFEIWSKVYLSRCIDYDNISLEFPQIHIMSREKFAEVYKDFSFSDFSVDYKEYDDNRLEASGYVEIKYKGSALGNSIFGGKQKFTLLAYDGSLGWKVTLFSLDY